MYDLSSSVTNLPGIGDSVSAKLAKLQINSIFDLLYHIPFRYEDRSLISSPHQIQIGETVTTIGKIDSIKNEVTKSGRLFQRAKISNEYGGIDAIWFHQPFLTKTLKPGLSVAMYGKADFFGNKKALISPEYEIIQDNSDLANLTHMGRIVPIYPETSGLTSKWFRNTLKKLLPNLANNFPNLVPHVIDWKQALQAIHFPHSFTDIPSAKNRLAADEILLLHLAGMSRKSAWDTKKTAPKFKHTDLINKFIQTLPFSLTNSQSNAINEIMADLSQDTPMNRLLEGDVGSGKTIVAAVSAFISHLNNFQTLILAPTQILANQHFQTLEKLFAPLEISVGLITANHKIKNPEKISILIGTHALLSDKLSLKNVGLVIIDEQHRFGVAQRSLATIKGESPHVLTMTATPIPRTLALTIHGDLDVSYLDKPPSGRLPIKTWVVPESKRDASYQWIDSQIKTHSSQVFVVCPFIEPSESKDTVKSATDEYSKLKSIYPQYQIELLHGKLKSSEKDKIMANFKSGKTQILVATPIVEVGIDIPNASIIVIETADRFGLAQLHQLRGRVGRGTLQSYCLLFSSSENINRLKALETNSDGRSLAEIDFQLRGPGHLYGTAQHGSVQFKIATYDNLELISEVKQIATNIFPNLKSYPLLLKLVENDKISLIQPN